MLSNLTDAPYTGETALLFNFTRQPRVDAITPGKGWLPLIVYFAFLFYIGFGLLFALMAIHVIRRWIYIQSQITIPAPEWQFLGWSVLFLFGVAASLFVNAAFGLLCLLLAQFLPRVKQKKLF